MISALIVLLIITGIVLFVWRNKIRFDRRNSGLPEYSSYSQKIRAYVADATMLALGCGLVVLGVSLWLGGFPKLEGAILFFLLSCTVYVWTRGKV